MLVQRDLESLNSLHLLQVYSDVRLNWFYPEETEAGNLSQRLVDLDCISTNATRHADRQHSHMHCSVPVTLALISTLLNWCTVSQSTFLRQESIPPFDHKRSTTDLSDTPIPGSDSPSFKQWCVRRLRSPFSSRSSYQLEHSLSKALRQLPVRHSSN
jgi:hypothetical protein